MAGWIKLNREISNHWIWKDASYLKAWVALLLSANHEEKKVLIHGELLICKRGQTIMSLTSLAKLFGKEWSIQRVRTFLKLLSDDAMIEFEGLRKTTRVTICKYDSYQSIQQTDNKQTTSKQHSDNKQTTTTKECKEIEERKEVKNKEEIFESLWKQYPTKAGKAKAKEKFLKLSEDSIILIEHHLPIFSVNKEFSTYNHPHLTTYLNEKRYLDEIVDKRQLIPDNQDDILKMKFKDPPEKMPGYRVISSGDSFRYGLIENNQ